MISGLSEPFSHEKVASFSGPLPESEPVSGSTFIVTLSRADGGLVAKGGALTGFMIAGADQKWLPAEARIDGDTVVVSQSIDLGQLVRPCVMPGLGTVAGSSGQWPQRLPASPF